MAEQDESSMIGYDPLAWMHEAEAEDLQSGHGPTDEAVNSDEVADESGLVDASLSALAGATVEPGPNEDDLATTVSATDRDAACQIVLEPVQNIQTVGQLHQQLQRMLDNSNKIDIDASAVMQIDTATMQLLLVLKLTAVKQQKEVSIDFPSEKFMEASDLLGLSGMLSVDQSASGFF